MIDDAQGGKAQQEVVQSIRFDAMGMAYCPTCGKQLGFRDTCKCKTMLFLGTAWLDRGESFYCPKCLTRMAYASSDRTPEELAEKLAGIVARARADLRGE